MIIEIEQGKLKKLTAAEQEVVNYINENYKKIPTMSITDVAEESFTSPATVSRTIKKCGMEGFSELRYRISSKYNWNKETEEINTILDKSFVEVTKTIENIKVDSILKITSLIKGSRRVVILAKGLTELVAQEFTLKLQLLGYNTFFLNDSNIMSKIELLIKQEDLLFIFSLKNGTPELNIAAKVAYEKGIDVVSCCCVKGADFEKFSTVVVNGYKQQRISIKQFEVTSRLPLFIISRVIIDYLII